MKSVLTVLLIVLAAISGFTQENALVLSPIILDNYLTDAKYTKTVYSIDTQFARGDTVLLMQKNPFLNIENVEVRSVHELVFGIAVDSGFTDFTTHTLVVLDSLSNKKLYAKLDFRYARPPVIGEVLIAQAGKTVRDTLTLSNVSRTVAYIMLKGEGLFSTTTIEFDDPSIKVLDGPGWRIESPPNELTLGLEIVGSEIEIGRKRFRIKNNYSMETWGEILLRSNRPPQIISSIPSFVADGTEHTLKIIGDNFYRGITTHLVPSEGFAKARLISRNQLEVLVNIGVLDRNKSFRLAVHNPDGQADTSGYFTVTAKPLDRARIKTIEQGNIFLSKKTRVIFSVDVRAGSRLYKNRSYEVAVEGNRFPVISVIDDSTCEAILRIDDDDANRLLNQHVFTINEVNMPARWKGVLTSKPAPRLFYMSPLRIIHPVDTLNLVFKGRNLQGVSIYIEDPEVVFRIDENRGDLMRVTAIAGKFVTPRSYPLELRIDGVPFIFDNYRIDVQHWQPFSEFVGIEISSLGFIPPDRLWRGNSIPRPIKASDAINVKIFAGKIREELGEQKVEISGVLMDSSNTIRAEAFNKRMVTVSNGTEIINWTWRVRERIRSGDRIEITLRNPGGQNKVTETFYVEPHWSESFHGSTSFILFKIPFGGGEASTEIFRSMGIGITYQPVKNRNFIAFDGSFILGNVAKAENNLSVEVGLGFSAILWSHLQIGIGTNLTGGSFNHAFTFVGTRFKIPVPW